MCALRPRIVHTIAQSRAHGVRTTAHTTDHNDQKLVARPVPHHAHRFSIVADGDVLPNVWAGVCKRSHMCVLQCGHRGECKLGNIEEHDYEATPCLHEWR